MLNSTNLKYELENTLSVNGKVGLILLATDQITLYEFNQILKDTHILCFPTRVMSATEITLEGLSAIKSCLSDAAKSILPSVDLDVVAFSCTSASMVIGSQEIATIIKKSDLNRTIRHTIDPFSAIKNACLFLKINKVALITPYIESVNKGIIEGMNQHNITIQQVASFNVSDDNLVPHITKQSIIDSVMAVSKDKEVKTIFVSCTNLNVCTYIQELEQLSGKTVLTSNQVMAFEILRLCNYTRSIDGFGQLLKKDR